MPTVCPKCGEVVLEGFRFCGMCGSNVTPSSESAQPEPATSNFGTSEPARPKAVLVLIKGEGFDVVTYQLNSEEHVIGSLYGTILFPDDRFLSPKHANIFYSGNKLMVRDEGSHNGVFVKISGQVELEHGDTFLAGEQLVRFDKVSSHRPLDMPPADPDTRFYGCPADENVLFRLVHLFSEGEEGAVLYAVRNTVTVGRERCDLSFPNDRHISGRHAKVAFDGQKFVLQDLGF